MTRRTHSLLLMSAAFFTSLITANSAMADYDKTIEDALKFGDGGAIKFDVNYRWENVDQNSGVKVNGVEPKTANANNCAKNKITATIKFTASLPPRLLLLRV